MPEDSLVVQLFYNYGLMIAMLAAVFEGFACGPCKFVHKCWDRKNYVDHPLFLSGDEGGPGNRSEVIKTVARWNW